MPSKNITVTETGPLKNIQISVPPESKTSVEVTVKGTPSKRIEISGTPGAPGAQGADAPELNDIPDLTLLFENGLL